MFDFFVDPHSWIPYNQIGLRRVLYGSSFVLRLIFDCFPISGKSALHLAFSMSRFCLICVAQESLLSSVIPKYLTLEEEGMTLLFK